MRRWLVLGTVVLVALAGAFLVLTGGSAPDATQTTAVPATGGAATLAISPVRSVVGSEPETISYTLGNDGAKPRTYAVSAAELSGKGAPLPDRRTSAGRWVRAEQDRVRVPAGSSVTTKVVVRPPSDRGASERRIGVTFTDTTPARGGAVGVRAQITTSVYVEGTGTAVRRTRLDRLDLPLLARKQLDVSARLTNDGTVTLVPGSSKDSVVATMSHGSPFSLGGDVAPAGSTITLRGTARDLPLACWCQVRVSAPDGSGGTTTVTGRVLVLPWPWLGAGLALVVLLAVADVRRRRAAPEKP